MALHGENVTEKEKGGKGEERYLSVEVSKYRGNIIHVRHSGNCDEVVIVRNPAFAVSIKAMVF